MNIKLLRLLFLLFPFASFAQIKDSLNTEIHYFKISYNVTYGFEKPKTLEMVQYIPKDIVALGKFSIQKENLKWGALAVGSTLALIPFDQKITEEADLIGGKIGVWNEDAKYKKITA